MFTRFNKKTGKFEIIRTVNTIERCPHCHHLHMVETEQVVKVLSDEEAQRFMARCAKIADDIRIDLRKLAD